MRTIDKIIVHCSDSKWGTASVIRKWHTDPPRNWRDIGYHAVILNGYPLTSTVFYENMDGMIQAGRPIERVGSHVKGQNRTSLGVCLIGVDTFTPKQYYSLRQILDVWRQYYGVDIEAIGGHRDYQQRPGKTCPNFDVRSFYAGEPDG